MLDAFRCSCCPNFYISVIFYKKVVEQDANIIRNVFSRTESLFPEVSGRYRDNLFAEGNLDNAVTKDNSGAMIDRYYLLSNQAQ